MVIATKFTIICGVLPTRMVHAKKQAPPATPATMFQGYKCGKKLISVYIESKQAAPDHCSMLFIMC